MNNSSQLIVTTFVLVGFEFHQHLKKVLFFHFLVTYILTLCANLLIIALVTKTQHLHSPMYFFLSHLSLSDIGLSTNVIPKLLQCLLGKRGISVTGCFTQFYFSGVFTCSECLLLTVMSYDRYLAICNPLHYISIMALKLRLNLVIWSWFLSFLLSLLILNQLSFLKFCGYNIIDHIYCDLAPLLQISCSDTFFLEIEITLFSIPLLISPFVFIVVTYIMIFLTILKISSSTGRKKAFSTCSSHLTVVCTYYGILIVKYTVPPRGNSLTMNKVMSLLYTMITPLLNPIIYSLRNQDISKAMSKWISMDRKGLYN